MNAAPSDLDEVLVALTDRAAEERRLAARLTSLTTTLASRPGPAPHPLHTAAVEELLTIVREHLPGRVEDVIFFGRLCAHRPIVPALRTLAGCASDLVHWSGAAEMPDAARVALQDFAARTRMAAWKLDRGEPPIVVGTTARADVAPVQCPDQLAGARCEKVAGHAGPHWNGSAWGSVGAAPAVEPRACCTYHASGGEEAAHGRTLASLTAPARVA